MSHPATRTKALVGLALMVLSVGASQAHSARNGALEVSRRETRPSRRGAPQTFAGVVEVQPLFPAVEHRRVSAGNVTFAPGARSAWHTHPAGQTLVITAGTGWVQEWGGRKVQVQAGDVVWTPPGVKHWHGATSTSAMTHIAIQEPVGGKVIDWLEHVTDPQYRD
jgi:quercetin dioxygenase-like cupin family protein